MEHITVRIEDRMEPTKTFVCHLRLKEHYTGAITASFVPEGDHINVGFSFCSPKDQFSKRLGRIISAGRLNKRPLTIGNLRKNDKGKLEIVPTLIQFFNEIFKYWRDDKQRKIEELLKVQPLYVRGESTPGDFLTWVSSLVEEVEHAYAAPKSQA